MIAIVMLDDHNGMLFNNRRQSQDAVLRERILSLAGERGLYMNAFSRKQFAKHPDAVITESESFLEEAGELDYAFVENVPLLPYEEKISKLIVYRWNREYPADMYLDLSLSEYHLTDSFELAGKSHEKITEEVYEK